MFSDTACNHTLHANAYEAMADDRLNPVVFNSYSALKLAILRQWDALRTVIRFERWAGEGDSAYQNSEAMRLDVTYSQHLWVYGTTPDQLDSSHPMSAPVPVQYRQDDLPLFNDIFRAVHDIMGHVRSGGSFGVNGECKAWIAHRDSMPAIAHTALWCETRGQAAWTNAYGDHASLPLSQRPFAVQKCGIPSQVDV